MAEEPAANLCDVRDAQPLAFCRASHHGYAVDGILPATDGDPHHALALSQCDRRQRSPLPGTFQVVPNPGKRTSTHGDALRRTQPVAGETGQKSRGVGVRLCLGAAAETGCPGMAGDTQKTIAATKLASTGE